MIVLLVPAAAAFRSTCAGAPPARQTENVVLITYDGLRWQELFGGADETLMNKEDGGVRGLPELKARFWRETPEERRVALFPFFWSTIAKQGQVFGDPAHNCPSRVTNGRNFSYPGYSEILCGFPDDRVDSNAKRPNPNVTVLEWLNGRRGLEGQVAAFGSWDVFPSIINTQRSGIPVNAGWSEFTVGPDVARLATLNDVVRDVQPAHQDVRDDGLTFLGTLEYIKAKKPRVLFVSFGLTDDWAHAGRYDLVLDAARRTDGYIERLWTALQAMPQYAGKTSLVMTTDHGRGDDRVQWKNHGKDTPGSDQMWIAVFGPDTPALGLRENVAVTQSQVAATVAALLGEDYPAAQPKAGAPLPGVVAAAAVDRK
ncbi:MAG TPA: hypothetical protein VL475_11650 [Planctomycetaceae bacterium]|nr:hypothetical protein [Planctomycetaceae bacterium]